jgi:hypothetical protein
MSEKHAPIHADEPAFLTPTWVHPSGEVVYGQTGLTKREYFAALMLQGFTASLYSVNLEVAVARSVQLADALIAELAK